MDRIRIRNRIYIAVLTAFAVSLLLLIYKVEIPAVKKQRVVLDTLGCQAAGRLGVKISAPDGGICVLDDQASLTLNWLTVGNVRIDADRVIAVQESK
jgi:hypothetical protein